MTIAPDVFIPPRVRELGRSPRNEGAPSRLRASRRMLRTTARPSVSAPIPDLEPPSTITDGTSILTALDALRTDRVLVTGPPGAGKTTTLRRLVAPLGDVPLPITTVFVPLRDVSDDLAALVTSRCRTRRVDVATADPAAVRLLLDGVNELSTSRARQQLRRFMDEHPTMPMVLTSRAVDDELPVTHKLEILPLDAEQIERFVRAQLEPPRAQDLLRRLGSGLGRSDVARVPMLLSWQCRAFESGGPLSSGVAEALEVFVRSYEHRRRREVPDDAIGRWDDAMQVLAEAMTNAGDTAAELTIAEERARELLAAMLASDGVSEPKLGVQRLLDELTSWHLLLRHGNGKLEIVHQLVQEHYAARSLHARLDRLLADREALCRDYLDRTSWTPPLTLLMARLRETEAKSLVQAAMTVDVMLAARLVGAAALELHPRLLPLLALDEASPTLELAVLGRARSPASIDRVARQARSGSRRVQYDALDVLQQIGTPQAAQEIARILDDGPDEIRVFVARLLVPIADVECVDALLRALERPDVSLRQLALRALVQIPDLEQSRGWSTVVERFVGLASSQALRARWPLELPSTRTLVRILMHALEHPGVPAHAFHSLLWCLRHHVERMGTKVDLGPLFTRMESEGRIVILQIHDSAWMDLDPGLVLAHVDLECWEEARALGVWMNDEGVVLEPRTLAALVRHPKLRMEGLSRSAKQQALARLGAIATPEAEQELVGLLDAPLPEHVRRAAFSVLVRGHGRPQLDRCFERVLDPVLGDLAIARIVACRDRTTTEGLARELLAHGDEQSHRQLVEALFHTYQLEQASRARRGRDYEMARMIRRTEGDPDLAEDELARLGAELVELGHDDAVHEIARRCFERSCEGCNEPDDDATAVLLGLGRPVVGLDFDELAEGIASAWLEGLERARGTENWSITSRGADLLPYLGPVLTERGATALVDLVAAFPGWPSAPGSAKAMLPMLFAKQRISWLLERSKHEDTSIRLLAIDTLQRRRDELALLDDEAKARIVVDLQRQLTASRLPADRVLPLLEAITPDEAGQCFAEVVPSFENAHERYFLMEALLKSRSAESGALWLLAHEDASVRREAAAWATNPASSRVVVRLRQLLGDVEPHVRVAAASALADAGHHDREVVESLLVRLDDPGTAWKAAQALTRIPTLEAFTAVWDRRHALVPPSPHHRDVHLGSWLGRLPEDARGRFIRSRLSAGSSEAHGVLRLAFYAGVAIVLEDLVAALRRYETLEPDRYDLRLMPPAAEQCNRLVELLGDDDPRVRSMAHAILLGVPQEGPWIERLAAVVEDQEHLGSCSAFFLLHQLPSRLVPIAAVRLEDPETSRHAAWLLLKADAQDYFPRILELHASNSRAMGTFDGWAVASAFERLGPRTDPKLVERVMEQLEPEARDGAVGSRLLACLTKVGGSESVRVLVEHAENSSRHWWARNPLWKLAEQDPHARTALLDAIASGKPWVSHGSCTPEMLSYFREGSLEDAILRAYDLCRDEVVSDDWGFDSHLVWVIGAMGAWGAARSRERLRTLLHHRPVYTVGSAAEAALSQIQDRTGRYGFAARPGRVGEDPPPTTAPRQGYCDVFISHHPRERETVDGLRRRLERSELSVWDEARDILPGELWPAKLESALQDASVVLICVGSEGIEGWFLEQHQFAMARLATESAQWVIPVLLPGGPAATGLPGLLASRRAVDLRETEDWEEGCAALIEEIRKHLVADGRGTNQ